MAVQNSLARQDQSMKLSVYLQNDAVKKQINQVVGGKNGTRFISSIVSAVQSTPALQECTSPSIVNAALLGEALNLSPSPQLGQFYMVPFDNKKKGCKEAQFQLGYAVKKICIWMITATTILIAMKWTGSAWCLWAFLIPALLE